MRWSGVQRFDGCANVGALREHAEAGGCSGMVGQLHRQVLSLGLFKLQVGTHPTGCHCHRSGRKGLLGATRQLGGLLHRVPRGQIMHGSAQ